jgi:chemotaxis protein CheC
VTAQNGLELTDLELDALTELVNLGVSRAATSLALMVRDEVVLSVPKVAMLTREEAIRTLSRRERNNLVGVHQIFEGDITGRALLIFPEEQSLDLVRSVIGGQLSLEEIIELEQEALAETGNVILNSCLATMANALESSWRISLPEVLRGECERFFKLQPPPELGSRVMFMAINFSIRSKNVDGYIAMLMDIPSLSTLKTLLAKLIQRTAGASAE